VLHPDICDGDIIFDVIWAKRFQGQDSPCVHHTRPGHSMCIPWLNTLYTMNEYAVHMECPSLGFSWSKLNHRFCHHDRCLDTAHNVILIFYLYYNINTVSTLYLITDLQQSINVVQRQIPYVHFYHLSMTTYNMYCTSLWCL
jgi:hypothetical protein